MEFLVVHFIFKSLSGPSGAVISTYCWALRLFEICNAYK
jgi:hypothetical protein